MSQTVAQRYASAEQELVTARARSARRGPPMLIAVCLVLCLAVAATAVVDLRRLQTPRGTALAWTGAAVFGDCTAYRRLSLPVPGARTRREGEDERCRALRRATDDARDHAASIGIDVVSVRRTGDTARVVVRLRRPETAPRVVPLDLRRKGDGWGVLLTDEVCRVVSCP